MSADEFVAWQAYNWLSPLGGERADRHAALISSILANINRDAKTHPEAFTLDDFDLYRDRRPPTREEEEETFRRSLEAAGLYVRKPR